MINVGVDAWGGNPISEHALIEPGYLNRRTAIAIAFVDYVAAKLPFHIETRLDLNRLPSSRRYEAPRSALEARYEKKRPGHPTQGRSASRRASDYITGTACPRASRPLTGLVETSSASVPCLPAVQEQGR